MEAFEKIKRQVVQEIREQLEMDGIPPAGQACE